ncbi:hypothetical protein CAPTEDRAFT_176086 [Capitella teleta]|uniref:Neurotransmitter-gated ion-channel ligand-binding domain-containing protein n=1 Tax=Capitella teleta TaxID=283909 RepID=R7TUE8_CAPTE|nr:hypothetical protein CAPTEDRAFT_176086 [Capitella teleta]|eukprot:ELT97538.1 hypothetical protein CAPTEDRAFT_176086 [Capitella teleta]
MFAHLLACVLVSSVLDYGRAVPEPDRTFFNEEHRLVTNLMKNYNKWIRPVLAHNDSLNVKFGLSILGIEDLDETSQVLTLHAWLRMSWMDLQLAWSPKDYAGVLSLRLPITEIWSPDIHLYNSLDGDFSYSYDALPVVYSTGMVMWIPQLRLRNRCSMDLSNFPFDTQKCTLRFGSWTYDQSKLNLTAFNEYNNLDLGVFKEHSEFELVHAQHVRSVRKYDCCPELYPDIEFNLELKRRSAYSTHLYLAPAIVVCLLTPFIFILPHGTGDKMMFGVGLILGHILLFNQLEQFIPSGFPNMPNISAYLITNLVLGAMAVVFSAINANLWSKSQHSKPVPGVIRSVFLGVLGRLMCIRRDDYIPVEEAERPMHRVLELQADVSLDSDPNDHDNMMKSYSRLTTTAEWRQLAAILDRLLFFLLTISVIMVGISLAHH